jgi:L-2-hydroxycarboxylate dehydrogenase (NAD+)
MWQEGREMLLPGELEYRSRVRRERDGIPLPPDLFTEVQALGEKYGLATGLVQ